MTTTTTDFRCSGASRADEEAMAGTAPTETGYLLVEHPGGWGRKAVAESRLPEEVRTHLAGLTAQTGTRVQLIRRHGGLVEGGVRVFAAAIGGGHTTVATALLDDVAELPELTATDFEPYGGPLWFVCTNGRRDLCCAEVGRPVTSALAGRWPEATWETTHLGGHRFAGTLLSLPTGVTLGRLDAGSAEEACREVEQGRLPLALTRGIAGRSGPVQVADLHLRSELGLDGIDDVTPESEDASRQDDHDLTVVRLRTETARYEVRVTTTHGVPRRQSCADLTTKPAEVYAVASWVPLP